LKKLIYLLYFSLLFSCEKKKNDIDNNSDNNEIADLIEFAQNQKKSISQRNLANDKAFDLLENSKSNKLNDSLLLKISSNYLDLNNKRGFVISCNLLIAKSQKSKDTISLANGYLLFGDYYLTNYVNDSAYFFFSKSEKLFLAKKDNKKLIHIYIKKATTQLYNDDYIGAELSATKALKIINEFEDYEKKYDALNILGIVSFEMANYDKAIEYHNKAIESLSKYDYENKKLLKALSLNNIGYTYQNINKHKTAIKYFDEALKEKSLKQIVPGLYATLIDNIAYSKFQQNDYSKLPSLFIESLKIRDSLELTSKVIYSKIHLSEFYKKSNQPDYSLKYAKEALSDARATKNPGDILFALKHLAETDIENRAKYSSEYIKISDSLQDTERKSKDKFARIAFETDEIIQQKDILEDKNRSLLYTFIGVLFLLSLLFVVRAQRARTKELMFKQAQQRANEEIYNLLMAQQDIIDQSREIEKRKIARDLHDGILSRMFGARLNLDSINHLEDPESVKKRLEYLNELKEIEQDIREISHDLSREKQDLINNFVSITTNLFEEQSLTHPAKLTYFMDSSIKWDLVKNNIKINVFRILQESLQNINKYAKANNIHVEFRKENGELYITITDDGVGFDIAKKSKGIGMQNMISRAIDCNGKLDISSNKENGTKITLTIPLE
jgi:signal transduction histidine kinase